MGTTLQHGIFLPAEGERNCYAGLASNWTILDGVVGGYSSHAANLTIHVTAADKEAWNGKADASALTAHTGDTTIHVTAADKQTWNGKQDALSQTQLDAVNSGIDSTKVQQIATNTSDISSLQSGKANDNSVVHTSGDETVGGQKTFSDINAISSSAEIGVSGGNNSFKVLDKNKKTISRLDGGTYSSGMAYSYWLVNNGSDAFNGVTLYQSSANSAQLRPYASTLSLQLGSSSRSFSDCYTSKINGLTLSGLSLPNYPAGKVDISAYITDLSGANNNYTSPANGYIFVRTTNGTYLKLLEYTSGVSSSVCSQTADDIGTFIPVLSGRICIIAVKCSSIDRAYFIPCIGNI